MKSLLIVILLMHLLFFNSSEKRLMETDDSSSNIPNNIENVNSDIDETISKNEYGDSYNTKNGTKNDSLIYGGVNFSEYDFNDIYESYPDQFNDFPEMNITSNNKTVIEEEILPIEIGKILKDSNKKIYSSKIYSLTIKKNSLESSNLFIELNTIEDSFVYISHAELYVSKKNKNPDSKYNSDYFSTSPFSNLISIENVIEDETFYIGVYCNNHCSYTLEATISQYLQIKNGLSYKINLGSNPIMFEYKNNNISDTLINFYSYSKNREDFLYLIGENKIPTSKEDSLPIISGIFNSYKLDQSKCIGCTYYILIKGLYNDYISEITVGVSSSSHLQTLKTGENIFGSVLKNEDYCYNLRIEKNRFVDFEDEELFIDVSVFSGFFELELRYENYSEKNQSFEVHTHKSVITDFKDFLKSKDKDVVFLNLNICFIGLENSSFLFKAYFTRQIKDIQNFNYLIRDIPIVGHLPANYMTRYEILENYYFDNFSGSITLNMDIIYGNLNFKFFYCFKEDECLVDDDFLKKNDNILIDSTSLSTSSKEIRIKTDENKCSQYFKNQNMHQMSGSDGLSRYCNLMIIVECLEINCSYKISYFKALSYVLLSPRISYTKSILQDEFDYYLINIEDESVKNLSIIKNDINGYSWITAIKLDDKIKISNSVKENSSFNHINNFYDDNYSSILNPKTLQDISNNIINSKSTNIDLPEIINFNKKDSNTEDKDFSINIDKFDNLKGLYLVGVYGKEYSTYHISYYTLNEDLSNDVGTNKKEVTHLLPLNYSIKDYFHTSSHRVYVVRIPKLEIKRGIRIVFTPERGQYEIFCSFNNNFTISDKSDNVNGYEFKSLDINNEILITKDKLPDGQFNFFILVLRKNNDNIKHNLEAYMFYIGVNLENSIFYLLDSVNNDITLNSQFPFQKFSHKIVNKDKDKDKRIIMNAFNASVNLYAGYSTSMFDEYYNLKRNKYKLLNAKNGILDVLSECEDDTQSCYLFVYLELKDKISEANVIISIKDSIDVNERLSEGIEINRNSFVGDINYFYGYINNLNIPTKISLNTISNYARLMVKLLPFSEYLSKQNIYEEDYPTKKNADFLIEEKQLETQLIINPEDQVKCKEHCVILISVELLNIFTNQVKNSNNYDQKIKSSYTILLNSLNTRISLNSKIYGKFKFQIVDYYLVYANKDLQKIKFILDSLSGESDMFINYGNTFPSNKQYDYHTNSNSLTEIIEVDKFNTKNTNDDYWNKTVSGIYSIAIYGRKNSKYSFLVTEKNVVIDNLTDSNHNNCQLSEKNSNCYYRYSEFEDYKSYNKGDIIEVLFFIDTLYGDYEMFAKLELYDDESIIPDISSWSNQQSEKDKNYIVYKVVVNEQFIISDHPHILVAIQSKSDELLLRIKTTKINKFYNQSNQLYNTEDKYMSKEVILGEETVGFLDDFNSRIIYYFRTNKESLTLNFNSIKGLGIIEIYKENENITIPSNQMLGKNILKIESNISLQNNVLHGEFLTYSKNEVSSYYIVFSTKFNVGNLPFIFKFNIFNDNEVVFFYVNKEISLNMPVGKNIVGYFQIDSNYDQLHFTLKRTKYLKSKPMSLELEKGNNWSPIHVYMNYIIIKSDSDSYREDDINIPTSQNHDINCIYNGITNSIIEVIPLHSKFKGEKLLVSINLINNDDEEFYLTFKAIPKVSNSLTETVNPFTYYKNTVQIRGEITLKLPYIIQIKDQNLSEEMYEEKKFVLEFSTCDGDMEVTVFKNSYLNEDHSIKKIIAIENTFITIESNKDVYVKIRPIKGAKKLNNDKKVEEFVSFTIIYQVYNNKNHIEDEFNDQGTITYGVLDNKVKINWQGLKMYDNTKNSFFYEENVTYFIFSVKERDQYWKMKSTCFLTELSPTYFTKEKFNDLTNFAQMKYYNSLQNNNKTVDYNLEHNGIGIINSDALTKETDANHSLIIELAYNKVIYVNVLAISKSGLSFSYSPIEIFIPSAEYDALYTIIAILFFTVILLICLRSYYKKYKIAKLALKMELNSNINSSLNDFNDSQSNHNSNIDLNVERLDKTSEFNHKNPITNDNILDEYTNDDIDRAKNMVEKMSNEIINKTKGYSDLNEE